MILVIFSLTKLLQQGTPHFIENTYLNRDFSIKRKEKSFFYCKFTHNTIATRPQGSVKIIHIKHSKQTESMRIVPIIC